MKRFSKIIAALAAAPVLAVSGLALAASPGQLAGGDNYLVKNLTQKGSYANTISATCNDEIQYSMQLSNTQFGGLNNVTLKATLPSNGGVSTATATTDLGGTSGTSDTVTVNLGSGQTQSLESGTTILFDDKGNAIKTLPDTITSGVNIGTLNGSTTKFVNFKAKVNCPTPVHPQFSCTALDVVTSSGRKADATVRFTATGGASLNSVNFNWGDGSASTTTSQTSASHTYNQDGTFTIKSILTFNVGGGDKNIATDTCSKTVSFTTPTTPQTPPTGGELPNTGPGNVVGLFAGVSAIAGAGHYFVARRVRQ